MPKTDSRVRALLVLPHTLPQQLGERERGLLGRGDTLSGGTRRNPAERLLELLGMNVSLGAPAALRYLGQTGRLPDDRVAAADPVCFDAAMDSLRAHALDPEPLAAAFDELCTELNEKLGDDALRFEQIAGRGYVFAASLGVAARMPASEFDGADPSPFLPRGAEAASYHRLMSEVQMVLHGSAVNERREAAGLPPVNALWIWGAGDRPEPLPAPLPALYADDPLFGGVWRHAGREAQPAPASVGACLQGEDFVCVPRADADAARLVAEAATLLVDGRLSALAIVLAGGQVLSLKRWQRLRFWRSPLTPAGEGA